MSRRPLVLLRLSLVLRLDSSEVARKVLEERIGLVRRESTLWPAAYRRRRGQGSLEAVRCSIRDATFLVLFEAARNHLSVFPIPYLSQQLVLRLDAAITQH